MWPCMDLLYVDRWPNDAYRVINARRKTVRDNHWSEDYLTATGMRRDSHWSDT